MVEPHGFPCTSVNIPSTPKIFMVCKWSSDLNTINHKCCGASWLSGRHQYANFMPFCTESPAQRSCPRSIRLVSPRERRIHSNHSDELPIGGMYDGSGGKERNRSASGYSNNHSHITWSLFPEPSMAIGARKWTRLVV